MRTHLYRLISGIALLALMLAGMPAKPAYAAGIVVNTPNAIFSIFDGKCDIYEAVSNANGGSNSDCAAGSPGADTITFAGNYTISLGLGQLNITSDVTIDGNGSGNTILRTKDCDPVTGLDSTNAACTAATWRVFAISSGHSLTLDSLTVRNGACSGSCPAGVGLSGTSQDGGGVYNDGGSLTISNSIVSENVAGAKGGGVYNNGGSLSLTSSSMWNNSAVYGGGVYNTSGSLAVTQTTFLGNRAPFGYGGAVNNAGQLTVTSSTFLLNLADENGGGIMNAGTASVTNSTFSQNAALNGGGIASTFPGSLSLTNSTLSANRASNLGAGVYVDTTLGLNYANTIIANSTQGGDCHTSLDAIGTNTNNLVQDGSCSAALSGDPKLGPLASNGGTSQTMTLGFGSPAINAGSDSVCAASPVSGLDQRGVARPKGPHCDIGAVEQSVYPARTDFEPDGVTDPTKLTSGGAVWYLRSSDTTWHGQLIGTDGSYIPRSDFNGDGKTDPAKFVTNAIWYLSSGDSAWHGVYIGSDGTPIPGSDYDGDGKTDPAKLVGGYIWYFGSLDSAWHGVYIGNDGTLISGSDFDGDGKTDPAKFVAGTVWYFGSADSAWHGIYIGGDGTLMPGADYDADGKTDPAKFVTNTVWYFGSKDSAWHGLYLGSDGSQVFSYDFDGDGKADPAKFVGGTTVWYFKSTTGTWDGRYLGSDTYSLVN